VYVLYDLEGLLMHESIGKKQTKKDKERGSKTSEEDAEKDERDLVQQLLEERDVLVQKISSKSGREKLEDGEKSILVSRVLQQQKLFEEHRRLDRERRAGEFKTMFPFLTREEINAAIFLCNGNEGEVIQRVLGAGELKTGGRAQAETFLLDIRRELCERESVRRQRRKRRLAEEEARKAAQRRKRKKRSGEKKVISGEGGEGTEEELGSGDETSKKPRYTGRLMLNDAVRDMDQSNWSEARKRAWALRESNPNAYYYRFLDPGEEQKTGPFSEEEEEVFLQRLAEVGANGKWGIFSHGLPGRVGYQCSAFYRQLVRESKVKDDRYYWTEDGKLKFSFSGAPDGASLTNPKTSSSEDMGLMGVEEERDVGGVGGSLIPLEEKSTVKKKRRKKTDDVALYDEEDGSDWDMFSWRTLGYARKGDAEGKGKKATKKKAKRKKKCRRRGSHNEDIIYADEVSEDSMEDEDHGLRRVLEEERMASRGSKMGSENVGTRIQEILEEDEEEEVGESETILPHVIDPITLTRMRKPAISQYGHVMNLSTWQRVLSENGNRCPFTGNTIMRGELVVLTAENLEEHRPNIKDLA
jgi:hypothetical protein